jgi:MurNAc alpha-1-phosphate uridylyltransferase
MVLAAGLGTRMRPLTDERPKALVEVGGKALIDYALDRLAVVGVEDVIVNLHHLGEQVEAHLADRQRPGTAFSDESAALLETGGGVAKALDRLGSEPFFVVNSDVLWHDGAHNTLTMLGTCWDDAQMDALLLAQPTVGAIGYDGRGDYHMDPMGGLCRRLEHEIAAFLFAGVQILHPRLFDGAPAGAFSLNLLYDRAEAASRLYGQRHEGIWAHVGTPEAIAEAEAVFRGR